jgi:serine/threonine-protein kinase
MALEPEIDAALPDYVVEKEIGRGGMGVVFLGHHARLGRRVAIKELPPSFAADPSVRDRFSTEARTLASLAHPHIVPIYDYVEREGLCLIVMEELPGGTVWDRFTTAGLTPPTACAIVMACCAALDHAHHEGVLHLDVKPDNLMFADNKAIKVTDFGISRVVSGDHTLGTLDGQVLGTPAYMSPEQAKGDELTKASDVYSTGVMLYELLSGHLPWTGAESATDLLLMRLREDPIPLRQQAPHVPEPLEKAVMKAIQREPEDRYASAEDFGVAIATACADSWGPSWLEASGVVIIGSDRLSIAARTTTNRAAIDLTTAETTTTSGSHAPLTVVGEGLDEDGATRAPGTIAARAVGGGATSTEAPPAAAAAAAPVMPEFQVVRAAGAEPRLQGANLNDIDRSAFVDLAEVIKAPASPRVPLLIAVGLAIAAIVAGALMFATPTHTGSRGRVLIAKQDPARVSTLKLDTSQNIPIRVASGPAVFATKAEMKVSAAGVPVGQMSATLTNHHGEFDTKAIKYLASGSLAGELTFSARNKPLASATQKMPVDVTRAWYLTAFGLGTLLVLLAGIAYLESSLRPLRRGRRRTFSYIGCALSLAVTATGLIGFLTALGHANPTASGVIVVAIIIALAGVALGETVRRNAVRQSMKHAVKRAARTLAAAA